MSEQLGRITPEMDEQEVLGLIIDELIDRAKPDMAEAIRLCAIPQWFNEEILAWLRGEGREPSERTGAILAELAKLAFVSPRRDHGYVYHENVRNLLLGRWQKENAGRFRELSGKTAAYCADMLRVEKLSEEQRAEWEREMMYHLLVADERRGIDLLINQLDDAGQSCRFSTFELLLSFAREQETNLSIRSQLWIRFYNGKLALLSGDWEEALKIWEALEGEREQVSEDLEKRLAAHLCFLYRDRGEWDKAVKCLQRSLKILKRANDGRGMAITYNNLGFLYKDREEWEKADKYFQRALKISEKAGDERGMVTTLNNVGLLSKDKEEWEQADGHFRRGLEILEKAGDERGMVTTLNNLGFLYKDRKEWEKADGYFRRGLEILEKAGDERGMVTTLNNLSFLYTDKKEWEKADGYLQRGLEILEKMGDERGKAAVLNNLGLLYKRKGEYEKAADYFRRSLKIVEKVGDEMNAVTTMYDIALLYEDMERYDEAVELLEKVVKICDRVGHPDLRIRRSREILERIKARATSSESASDQ